MLPAKTRICIGIDTAFTHKKNTEVLVLTFRQALSVPLPAVVIRWGRKHRRRHSAGKFLVA